MISTICMKKFITVVITALQNAEDSYSYYLYTLRALTVAIIMILMKNMLSYYYRATDRPTQLIN